MQSFITNGCVKQIYLYVLLTKNKISHINIIQQTKYTLNNKINEMMMIFEKIEKISNLD
jgi:hypothetical protein